MMFRLKFLSLHISLASSVSQFTFFQTHRIQIVFFPFPYFLVLNSELHAQEICSCFTLRQVEKKGEKERERSVG